VRAILRRIRKKYGIFPTNTTQNTVIKHITHISVQDFIESLEHFCGHGTYFTYFPCKKIDTIGCFSGKKSGDFAVQDGLFETPLNTFLNAFWEK
jgi:hypothetical protein